MAVEQCRRDYEHSPHEWCEGDNETHLCDGRLDDDQQEQTATQLVFETA